jgi:hypothetical protein
MNPLDAIKGATKFVRAQFLFGEAVNELQAKRLHICKTSGANGTPCHNFVLFDTPLGKRPRCCKNTMAGCQPHHNGCTCWLISKSKDKTEPCPLGRW